MKILLYLSHNGILSRRKAFDSIKAGMVRVNGEVVTEPSMIIDPSRDSVAFKGSSILSKRMDFVLLHKPAGYVTTCEGQFGQKTVMELLPRNLQHLRPVGRLDKDTEGLLILTNDGALANRLSHPRFDVDKTYYAKVKGRPSGQALRKLESGVVLDGEKTAPAKVLLLKSTRSDSEIQIVLHEGRKHQVKRMLKFVSCPVMYLKRLKQGPIELGNLKLRAWRRLTDKEVASLRAIHPLGGPTKRSKRSSREAALRSTSTAPAKGKASTPSIAPVRFGRMPKKIYKRDPFAKRREKKDATNKR